MVDVRQMDGVEGFFDHRKVPGHNDLGAVVHDEEVFASKVVTCIGQPISVIVADTEAKARAAARAVVIEYEDLPAVLSVEQAIAAGSYFQVSPRRVSEGVFHTRPGRDAAA
jgi:xanthine dehydrogenase/oxidase